MSDEEKTSESLLYRVLRTWRRKDSDKQTKRRELDKHKNHHHHHSGDRALSNMRRRAYDSFLVTSGAKEHDLLSKDELKFLQAAEIGDLPTVKLMLEEDERAPKLLRCTDYKDRTALEVATENEHLEIVEYLVQKGGRTLDIQVIHESLMLAISKGYLRITQALLNHPVNQQSKGKFRLGSLTNYYQRKNTSKFEQDVTPLMLAAHCNEIDIIRLLLNRGDTIKKPHNSLCQCTYCSNKKQFDPLKHSMAGLNTYRSLASPAYIALTSPDPILTAFLLSQELMTNAKIEKEFKNEYRDLARQCKEFASDLLDMCQNSEEVRTILNNEATSLEESEQERATNWLRAGAGVDEGVRVPSLARLKLAIKLRQKQFVAHSHCQHELATLWYRHFPSWRLMGQTKKVLCSALIILGLPFFTIAYFLAPNSQIGVFVSSPLVKFILYSSSYIVFLLVIFVESLYAQAESSGHIHVASEYKLTMALLNQTDCHALFPQLDTDENVHLRFFKLTPLEIVIVIFLCGFLWSEVKQLWGEGLRAYLASIWNWIDIAMLNLYLASCTLNIYSASRASIAKRYFMDSANEACTAVLNNDSRAETNFYFLQGDRLLWQNNDPIFVSEALYALANVLSFSRLSYILPVSEFLGPLQISLGRMLGDILRFAVVFIVVFLAFFCSMFNLYYSYEDSNFGNVSSAFLTLFWALFGLGTPRDPYVNSDSCTDQTQAERSRYSLTETFGTLLYMIYYVVMGLVMLNMLIAMMSNSFQEINSEQDVEWKFARAQLWMSYFQKGATIPVPFNIIPSPKSCIHFYRWVVRQISALRHGRPPEDAANAVPLGERRNGVFNILSRLELRREESTHESITKGIIKRYLFKLQRDKDNDEVNEGELDEIKNDISSLRFELMEQLRGPRTPAPTNVPSSAPAFTFSFPSNASKQTTPSPDMSIELHALKNKIAELTSTVELLARATVVRQEKSRDLGRAGNDDRNPQRSSFQSLDSDVGLTMLDYDVAARHGSSQRVADVSDIVAGCDDANMQQGGFTTTNCGGNFGGLEFDGDSRQGSAAQRPYDIGNTSGPVNRSSQRSTVPRGNMASNIGRAASYNPGRRWSTSPPPRVGRNAMASDIDKPRVSRTLSRGSIHVGFDLETRHDRGLIIVNEESIDHGFEQPSAARVPASGSRTFDTPSGAGGRDFDNRRDDCADDGNRSRYDSDQEVPVISGLQGGHYNIAFSLDT